MSTNCPSPDWSRSRSAARMHTAALRAPHQAKVIHVVPRAVAVGAVLAVPGDRAVDEPLVHLVQPLVADAEAVEHARAEGLQQHVVLAGESQQHVAPAL